MSERIAACRKLRTVPNLPPESLTLAEIMQELAEAPAALEVAVGRRRARLDGSQSRPNLEVFAGEINGAANDCARLNHLSPCCWERSEVLDPMDLSLWRLALDRGRAAWHAALLPLVAQVYRVRDRFDFDGDSMFPFVAPSAESVRQRANDYQSLGVEPERYLAWRRSVIARIETEATKLYRWPQFAAAGLATMYPADAGRGEFTADRRGTWATAARRV